MNTIFMVPGLFGNKDVWDKIQDFFEGLKFKCFPVTLPYRVNFARIPNPKLVEICTKDDINFLLMQIAKIKETLRPDEPFIGMGYSRGALLVLMLQEIFAKRGKKLFDKIVLITPAPPKGIKAFSWSGLKGYLCLRPIWWFLGTPVKRTFAGMASAVMDDFISQTDKRRIYEGLSWESGRVVAETLFSPPEIDPTKINCPVLVIAGKRDRLIPLAATVEIAKMFMASFYKADGPHLILKGEAREEICQAILNWLWELN